KGRGNGYILRLGDQRVYFSGDTECTSEMRALENVDVAFVCMNLPYTMPPSEAIDCVRAFAPKVVVPYHYRGSDVQEVVRAFAETPAIEVRTAEWYPGGEG
ncbi:MAG: MBL fold metallo-hydrolase, partial [Myxococcales bacterium]|nr:MBL fold metallo-hydrolase [Myxococcales bacterium]